ncbi:hypothetical protein [Mesorhizobium sp. M0276]|uniref:hypothetical protein n=1 Tax=Mesorhizobium sp. M0276 TaxID=2956928 RepID=UPI003335657E
MRQYGLAEGLPTHGADLVRHTFGAKLALADRVLSPVEIAGHSSIQAALPA